jgi:hypothetical protein
LSSASYLALALFESTASGIIFSTIADMVLLSGDERLGVLLSELNLRCRDPRRCAGREASAIAAMVRRSSSNHLPLTTSPPHEIFWPAWGLPLYRAEWSSHRRRFNGRNVNKRAIPILSVNQFHASATNESGVFVVSASLGALCISHAHWRPLPLRSCVPRLRLVGDEALVLLSKVFIHLWRHTGSFEVAFPQLAPPGPAFASVMQLLA